MQNGVILQNGIKKSYFVGLIKTLRKCEISSNVLIPLGDRSNYKQPINIDRTQSYQWKENRKKKESICKRIWIKFFLPFVRDRKPYTKFSVIQKTQLTEISASNEKKFIDQWERINEKKTIHQGGKNELNRLKKW